MVSDISHMKEPFPTTKPQQCLAVSRALANGVEREPGKKRFAFARSSEVVSNCERVIVDAE